MKYQLYIPLLYLVLLSVSPEIDAQSIEYIQDDPQLTFAEKIVQIEARFDKIGRGKHSGYKQYQRWRSSHEPYVRSDGYLPSERDLTNSYLKSQKSAKRTRALKTGIDPSDLWTNLGPAISNNTSSQTSSNGRLNGIAVAADDMDHIIVAAAGGGVFQTTNNGGSWIPIFDSQADLRIFSVGISPHDSDIYYAGTQSAGFFRSVDRGSTWNEVSGIGTFNFIKEIQFHPTDPNIILAGSGGRSGLYRTVDGGLNWDFILAPRFGEVDIAFKPGDPNIVYATGFGEVYRSTDAGASFTELSGPWAEDGYIKVAVTPDDPDYVYILQAMGNRFGGLYLSKDDGSTFDTQFIHTQPNSNILGATLDASLGQAPRCMDIAVDPMDKSRVHVGGIIAFSSTDEGQSWTKSGTRFIVEPEAFIHADVEQMNFVANRLYIATDGGIFYSDDHLSTVTDLTPGLPIRQFYSLDVADQDRTTVGFGSQDNGLGLFFESQWRDWAGADGIDIFISKHDKNKIMGSFQQGVLIKSEDGGLTNFGLGAGPYGLGRFLTYMAEDPLEADVLYQGKNELIRSMDFGTTWDTVTNLNLGYINRVAISSVDNDILYIGSDRKIFTSTDRGESWTDITPPQVTSSIATMYIYIHPDDPDRVLVTSGHFDTVFESQDGGDTWTDLKHDLPSNFTRCAIYAPNGDIYASTSKAVYHLAAGASSWTNISKNLPVLDVTELEVDHGNLYAATYGRGLWAVPLSCGNTDVSTCLCAAEITSNNLYSAPGPSTGDGCHNCTNANDANWYRFTPDTDGWLSIASCNGGVDTRLFVYEGDCDNLTQVAAGDDECSITPGGNNFASLINDIPVTAGATYYLEWDNRWSSAGFDFSVIFCPANIVTNTSSLGCGSLRYAIERAADGDTIRFSSTVHNRAITVVAPIISIDKDLFIIADKSANISLTHPTGNAEVLITVDGNLEISGLSLVSQVNGEFILLLEQGSTLSVIDCDIDAGVDIRKE